MINYEYYNNMLHCTLAVTAMVESRASLGGSSGVVISSSFSFCPLVLASSSV